MGVYICSRCKRVFEEENAMVRETTYEDEYGCGEFGYPSHSISIIQCPECGEEEDLEYYRNLYEEDFHGDFLTEEDNELFE